MGRWTHMDDDEYRLPEGMQRVGYDADTERYTFRSADGTLYTSAAGSRYGELVPIGRSDSPIATEEEIQSRNRIVEENNRDSVRMMLPFALLVLLFLFLVFKVINGGFGGSQLGSVTWADEKGSQILDCAQGSHQVQIKKGDTCWRIAQEYSLGIDEFLQLGGNEGIDCQKLAIGQGICVPV